MDMVAANAGKCPFSHGSAASASSTNLAVQRIGTGGQTS